MTAHPLLPPAMSALPAPWRDLTGERRRGLAELPDTEAVERTALDALDGALSGPLPGPGPAAWTDESWALYDRARQEIGRRLADAMPATGDLTREGVGAVLRDWAGSARPPVPQWWLDDQLDVICSAFAQTVLAGWVEDVLRRLGQRPHDAAAVASAAGRCVRHGLAPDAAAGLLRTLGVPYGEAELLALVTEGGVADGSRTAAREALLTLRRPARAARGRQPAHDEHPLLPPAVRELPYGWDRGFAWPVELPENEESVGRARAVLLACLPAEPVTEPVPDADTRVAQDEEAPAWAEIRSVLRDLMPYARQVTEERMAEGLRECARLGVPGVPAEPDGAEGARFARRWAGWIGGWIAAETFTWLGLYVDDESLVTPWAMELAERYARLGCVAERAVTMLAWHGSVPASRAALERLAADPALPPAVREQAARALES
ncbi:hypothetical protein [Streptomyces mangrovisoli]|uniref:Uncharacterized protein n=1 Tax=Streptomyces mangrovisoli TaxID=1428628 RepID=A0A1J4NR88_9ACTN|nr:hypothetical protein [Streptomyces mangrovisoli]OIJ63765.1 hypothetical protein WN71_032460 [Streptomyces mangrovisoli]